MQNRAIIEAIVNSDPTATTEEKARVMAALNPAKTNQKMITKKAVAELLGVHLQTVNNYTQRGLLRPVKFTKRAVRYAEAEILHFQQNGAAL